MKARYGSEYTEKKAEVIENLLKELTAVKVILSRKSKLNDEERYIVLKTVAKRVKNVHDTLPSTVSKVVSRNNSLYQTALNNSKKILTALKDDALSYEDYTKVVEKDFYQDIFSELSSNYNASYVDRLIGSVKQNALSFVEDATKGYLNAWDKLRDNELNLFEKQDIFDILPKKEKALEEANKVKEVLKKYDYEVIFE